MTRTIEKIATDLAAARTLYLNLAMANGYGIYGEERATRDVAFYKARKAYYDLQREMDEASGGPARPDDPVLMAQGAPQLPEYASLLSRIF